MSDRNMRNQLPGAGTAESRPDLMKDILPGGGSDDLDNLLVSLADDVPDMPADFHARWTAAVASEAGNCTQSGVPAGPQAEGIQAAASEAGSDAQGEAPARIWSEKAQMSVLHGAENDVSDMLLTLSRVLRYNLNPSSSFIALVVASLGISYPGA